MEKKSFMKVFLVLMIITLLAASASAAKIKTGEEIDFYEDVKDDLYLMGSDVYIEGKVTGDAFIMGSQVAVAGDITEDLLIMGGEVVLQSDVDDDVRIVGGDIRIDSQIKGDLVIIGGQVDIEDGSVVGKDLIVMAGDVKINANVNRDAKIIAGNVVINGPIDGDVLIKADALSFGKEGVIRGDLKYIGAKPDFDESKVEGNISKSSIELPRTKTQGSMALGRLLFFFMIFITGVFFLWLGRKYTDNVTDTLTKRPWFSLGIGILSLIVTPIIAILLMAIVITLPIGLFALMLYLFGLFFSMVFASIMIGKALFGRTRLNVYLSLFIGSIIFVLLTWVPILGAIVILASILFGMGAMTIVIFSSFKKKKEKRRNNNSRKRVKLDKVR
ncbi:MAG: polymer-forming cytoskeletal protein [archaeon]